MSFASEIRKARPGKDVFDRGERASVTGLHVRTRLSVEGVLQQSFMFYYRASGKQRRLRIGGVATMTIGQARAAAGRLAAQVALGGDPVAERDGARRQARARAQTVADLWAIIDRDHYQSETAEPRSWSAEAGRIWAKELRKRFGGTPAAALRRGEVRRWHATYRRADKGTAGNRALAVLRKIYSHAIEFEHYEGGNPCTLIKEHTEVERHRYATDEELARLAKILDRDMATHPRHVAFLWLLAYTGARPSAIAQATWDQLTRTTIDGQKVGVLEYVGKTTEETGIMGRVIVPAAALELLDRLPRVDGDPRIVGLAGVPRNYWTKARKEAGCPDLWARDWRKTFATLGLGAGESIEVIGQTLEQRSAQTTRRYARAVPRAQVRVATTVAGELDAVRARVAREAQE